METLRDLSRDGQREMGMGRQGRSGGSVHGLGAPCPGQTVGEQDPVPLLPHCNAGPPPVPTASPSPNCPLQPTPDAAGLAPPSLSWLRSFLCRSNLMRCAAAGSGLLGIRRQYTAKGSCDTGSPQILLREAGDRGDHLSLGLSVQRGNPQNKTKRETQALESMRGKRLYSGESEHRVWGRIWSYPWSCGFGRKSDYKKS